MTTTVSGSSITFNDNSIQNTAATGFGFKNRIINGDCRIDQRNAGASVTNTNAYLFSVDRWKCYGSVASKFTIQQNAGSVTPPSGFTNYMGVTSLSAYSVAATDQFFVVQPIEGLNTADLAWGSASAKTITISFWVRSSLTGTFGGLLWNSGGSRNYPFSYTISSANTWEQKTVTIAGDTTGTWLTNTSGGIFVQFNLGVGSTYTGTGNAWTGSAIYNPTGATSVVGTNGATWYITGVQLEKGSTDTSFDYRPYGTELALCQRYYIKYGTYSSNSIVAQGSAVGTTTAYVSLTFPVSMRTTPTFNSNTLTIGDGVNAATTVTGAVISSLTSDKYGAIDITVASGLTQYRPYTLRATATTGYTEWSAEL